MYVGKEETFAIIQRQYDCVCKNIKTSKVSY